MNFTNNHAILQTYLPAVLMQESLFMNRVVNDGNELADRSYGTYE